MEYMPFSDVSDEDFMPATFGQNLLAFVLSVLVIVLAGFALAII